MVGLELVAGYLVAWGARVGTRLDEQADDVFDIGLNSLHDAIAAKLSGDPMLGKLEEEVSLGRKPSAPTLRRVRDAVEEASEDDPDFAATIEALLAELQEARNGASSIAGIDLRKAKGVQVGDFNTQTNTFN
jgi:hypothetical protein